MSGKPSPEVTKYVADRMKVLRDSFRAAKVLEAEIASKKQQLEKQLSEYRTAKSDILKCLDDMDVDTSGNFGWEDRMTIFLIWLYSHIESKAMRTDETAGS